MLTNILAAWVVFEADCHAAMVAAGDTARCACVGYVQGMSFLAMNLLWHSGREEASFLMFVAMMRNCNLQTMFEPPDMHGLKMRAFTAIQLLRFAMPDLSDHLAEYLQNSLELLLADWLLTLFSSSVALGPLAELWDRFFELGYSAIYRLILSRLRALKPWLLQEKDFTQLTNLVRFAHVDFDRIDGQLVPRIRITGETPAETSAQKSWLERLATGTTGAVVGAAAWAASGVLGRGSTKEANCAVPRSCGQHPAAWTCQVCNGSEDCESWLCLVTELAQRERAPADLIERFEHMFGDGQRARLVERSRGATHVAAGAAAEATLEEPPVGVCVQCDRLRLERDELVREVAELRAQNALLQRSLREAGAQPQPEV